MRVPSPRTLIVGAALLALGVAGCGDEDESSPESSSSGKPAALAIEVTASGELKAPKSVPAGVTTITVRNGAKEPHSVQLARVDEGQDPQKGIEAGNAWASEGKPLPAWAHTEGGVPVVPPGASASSTQNLPPGQYAAFDTNAEPGQQKPALFEVTGEAGDAQLPSTEARIEANEYSFDATGLKAGRQRVLIDNAGAEPHFVAALQLKPGKTVDDVREFVETEKGQEPFIEEGEIATPVLDGKGKQVIDAEFKRGDYVLMCWVPDRKGGPPHAVKGMISAATVE